MNIETKTYKKITPETPGNLLTRYKDGGGYLKYESFRVMYTHADFDISTIHEITPEEDAAYKQARDKALHAELQS